MTGTEPTRTPGDELDHLRAHRAAKVEQLRSSGADFAAVMMVHPRTRDQLFAALALEPDNEAAMRLMIAVVDEVTLDRDTDVIMQPIVQRAASALAVVVVPDTAASLVDDDTPTA